MKKIAILAGLFIITACYALNIEHYLKEAREQITEDSLKLEEKLDARLPVSSQATAGLVPHRKVELAYLSYSIFIIGDDPSSYQWLKEHAKELEAKNALGFITNISDSKHLEALQALTKAPLLPANVDDLMAIFKESHYPLGFDGGELWQ